MWSATAAALPCRWGDGPGTGVRDSMAMHSRATRGEGHPLARKTAKLALWNLVRNFGAPEPRGASTASGERRDTPRTRGPADALGAEIEVSRELRTEYRVCSARSRALGGGAFRSSSPRGMGGLPR